MITHRLGMRTNNSLTRSVNVFLITTRLAYHMRSLQLSVSGESTRPKMDNVVLHALGMQIMVSEAKASNLVIKGE